MRLPVVLFVGLAIAGALALSWFDVLPGGWRLRRLVGSSPPGQARIDAQRIADHLARFRRENPAVAAGSIVFLGSSTIERFPLGREFPGKPCVNRGIANLSARELALILPDCLPAARPSAAVVYAGAVDWRDSGRDPEVLVEAVRAVLTGLDRALPDLPVLLSGILPAREMEDDALLALRTANGRLKSLADELGAAFVDPARPPISGPGGRLSTELSVDDVHLNGEGYGILARWILEDGGTIATLLAP